MKSKLNDENAKRDKYAKLAEMKMPLILADYKFALFRPSLISGHGGLLIAVVGLVAILVIS